MNYIIFDIEVLPNAFTCAFLNFKTKKIVVCEVSDRKCEIGKLFRIFLKEDRIFVGYNCAEFDTPIINKLFDKFYIADENYNYELIQSMFIKTAYLMSRGIIVEGKREEIWEYKFKNYFEQLDLLTLNFSSMQRVGLKELQVTMKYHNVEEMHVNWNSYISIDNLDKLISYNINDIQSTAKFLEISKPQIEIRSYANEKYGIKCDSMDAVTLCVNYVAKEYCKRTGLKLKEFLKAKRDYSDPFSIKEIILPFIEFKTDQCKKVLEWFQSKMYHPGNMKDNDSNHYVLLLNHKGYKFGFGGLHGMPRPNTWKQEKNPQFLYYQTDVQSEYPSCYLKHRIKPRHLSNAFFDVMQVPYDEKALYKKLKKKTEESFTKLILNSFFGKLNEPDSPFYDPVAAMSITINCQLILLMLIEDLVLNNFDVRNANTDSVDCIFHKDRLEEYLEVCRKWEEKSKFKLDHDAVKMISVMDCNNYLMQFDNGKVKVKGRTFLTNPVIGKGYLHPVVQLALVNYFKDNIPIEETIRKHDNIYDFCISEKTSKDFTVEWNGENQQRINRFYVSTKGAYLYKWKWSTRKIKKGKRVVKEIEEKAYTNMLKGYGVEIVNKIDNSKPISEYNINYGWYTFQARKIIEIIENKQLSLFGDIDFNDVPVITDSDYLNQLIFAGEDELEEHLIL